MIGGYVTDAGARADFRCAPSAVFKVLCDADSYRLWFGNSAGESLAYVEPDFCSGARMSFKGRGSTMIITSFVPDSLLSFTDSVETYTFTIEPAESGCVVTLRVQTVSVQENARAVNDYDCSVMLRAMKVPAYDLEPEQVDDKAQTGYSRAVASVESFVAGYRLPVDATMKRRRKVISEFIDDANRTVSLNLSSVAAALILCVVLFSALAVSTRFERSNIVPSSGLLLTQSDSVDREHAMSISIGQPKQELELMLNCQGQRLSSDEYFYCSVMCDDDGDPVSQIFVEYNAYGSVRRYAFVDRTISEQLLKVGIKNVGTSVAPSMSIANIEEAVGQPCSAFTVESSGALILHFGRYKADEDPLSTAFRSELFITVNKETATKTCDYYYRYDIMNVYPYDSMSGGLSSQFSRFDEYIESRYQSERSLMLCGKSMNQVAQILGSSGHTIESDEEGIIYYGYVIGSKLNSKVSFEYTVEYRDNIAQSVKYTESRLCTKGNGELGEYGERLSLGMSELEVRHLMEILPSGVTVDADGTVLGYGCFNGDDNRFALTAEFDRDGILRSFSYYDKSGNIVENDSTAEDL